MEGFVADRGVAGLAHIPDTQGEIWRRFGVRQQRTYVFINDDGTIRMSGYGNLDGDVQDLIAR